MLPSYLSKAQVNKFIKNALKEDVGDGDHTSNGSIPADDQSKANLLVKESGIIAGIELSKSIFENIDPSLQVEYLVKDGDAVSNGEIGFHLQGNTRNILKAERLVLNCLQRMSGIATYTFRLTQLIKGTNARLLDTRKTTPNFRAMEKWAVMIGGGFNHRFGLFDMILLKDNHIDYAGGVENAITSTKKYLQENNLELDVEIEVRNMMELEEVIETGSVKRVLLDNMLPSDMKSAIRLIDGKMETEASGGINEENIREIAETGVDYISIGALTHSYKSLDISLKAEK